MNDAEIVTLLNSVKSVSRETVERLTVFHDLLLQWQDRMNLIAPSTRHEVWTRHIADSLQVFALKPEAYHHTDIGSGAGFPGIISAILMIERGGGRVELIESNNKKCAFLQAAARALEFKKLNVDVVVHHGRIENVLNTLEQPDLLTARALASLDDLLRLTECMLEQGTVGLFSKGKDHQLEIEKAQKMWRFDYNVSPSRFEDQSVLLEILNLCKAD